MAIPSDMRNDYVFSGDVYFTGDVSLPDSTVTGDMISSSAEIAHTQVVHRFPITYNQADGTDVVAETRIVHQAYAGSTVLSAYAVLDEVPETGTGDKTVTIDIQKSTGGAAFATILSSTLTITDESDEKEPVTFSLSGSPTLVATDILRVVVTVAGSSGSQAQGMMVIIFVAEDPA